jgi:hypothetical protein
MCCADGRRKEYLVMDGRVRWWRRPPQDKPRERQHQAYDISTRRVTCYCNNELGNQKMSLTPCHSESLILLPLVERRSHTFGS